MNYSEKELYENILRNFKLFLKFYFLKKDQKFYKTEIRNGFKYSESTDLSQLFIVLLKENKIVKEVYTANRKKPIKRILYEFDIKICEQILNNFLINYEGFLTLKYKSEEEENAI